MKLKDSPVTQHNVEGRSFYLKRDDLLHSHFNGNKARKFATLLEHNNPTISRLIGWGSAQANSLTSLAALAKIKGWQLTYYVDHKPTWLDEKPMGNYRMALELGANIVSLSDHPDNPEKSHPSEFIQRQHSHDDTCLIVPEGGRFQRAEVGIRTLAREILAWARFEKNPNLKVALPSGTGTTALYLAKALHSEGIEVLTCPCVGGRDYLVKQFHELDEFDVHPTILQPDTKHHFGKLYQEDYAIWRLLQEQTDIEFDLLYDPLMWRCLLPWLEVNSDATVLYVHQGGLLGNETMLPRYERKFGARDNSKASW
ncbi:pyridoxal-phosphate dependent enzyme [Vibrio methylphosphonaticus]|uniref:pyridoxal-phosphate dependent enzyme n=1 Tax=Vibrio methylphosphonaticus TaxID=2946866 RepID=UPI002029C284|nr:pyridoxal-phosphate dependent enzyme [Vibrio methylphosphonaticus]MCL9774391.1 pyridoxal-phosphate dependent enzyme [Vibrio methylphosphonaticus]